MSIFDRGADTPGFQPAGDFGSVEGALRALGVPAGAALERKREAIAQAATVPGLHPLLQKLEPELRAAGLL